MQYKPLHEKGRKKNPSFLYIFLPTPQVAITAAILQHTLLFYTKNMYELYKWKKKLYQFVYPFNFIILESSSE